MVIGILGGNTPKSYVPLVDDKLMDQKLSTQMIDQTKMVTWCTVTHIPKCCWEARSFPGSRPYWGIINHHHRLMALFRDGWGLALGGTVLVFFSLPETRQTDFPTMVNHSEKPSVAVEELWIFYPTAWLDVCFLEPQKWSEVDKYSTWNTGVRRWVSFWEDRCELLVFGSVFGLREKWWAVPRNGSPFSLLNDKQMSNEVGVVRTNQFYSNFWQG